jgi:hypothetical protein
MSRVLTRWNLFGVCFILNLSKGKFVLFFWSVLGTVTAKRTETVYGVGVTPSFPQKTAFFSEKTVPATAATAAHLRKTKK